MDAINVLCFGGGDNDESVVYIVYSLTEFYKALGQNINGKYISITNVNLSFESLNREYIVSQIMLFNDTINIAINSIQSDFNDMLQLAKLGDKCEYDIIMFDRYSEYCVDWSFHHMQLVSNMLKIGGIFQMSDEITEHLRMITVVSPYDIDKVNNAMSDILTGFMRKMDNLLCAPFLISDANMSLGNIMHVIGYKNDLKFREKTKDAYIALNDRLLQIFGLKQIKNIRNITYRHISYKPNCKLYIKQCYYDHDIIHLCDKSLLDAHDVIDEYQMQIQNYSYA